jgi:putative two-component system response regulator
MSGFEACEILVDDSATKSIPIILVTALTDIEDIKKGLSAGAFDYIKKTLQSSRINCQSKLGIKV